MEIHPVDGNPTKGWLDFHPSVPKWLDGNPTILRSKADKVLWSVFKFSTFPFWSFQNSESESGLPFTRVWRFSSVEMGNSLEQYRASIGLFNSGARSIRKAPDVFWVAFKDLLLTILFLQCLLSGLFALQLQLLHQPSCGLGEEAVIISCPLAGKVGNK